MNRLGVLLAVALFVVACSGSDQRDSDTPSSPEPSSSAVTGSFTPVPPASTPSGIAPPPRQISGLFTEPRPVDATPVSLPEKPASTFPRWDNTSVTLYDTETGTATKFGPGHVASPAFGDGQFVYTSDGQAWLVDLATLQKKSLGPGYVAYFLGPTTVVINPGDNNFVAYNTKTGGTAPLTQLTDPLLKSMASQRSGGAFRAKWVDGRYAVRLAHDPELACAQSQTRDLCVAQAAEDWVVQDVQSGEVLYTFQANKAETAGPGEIVIATTPLCEDGDQIVDCYQLAERLRRQNPGNEDQVSAQGTTNIFAVDLTTGEASFIATATYNESARVWPQNWPLAASADYIVWSDSYCGPTGGQTYILDRSSGDITVIDQRLWVTIKAGRLGIGEFGARALLDPRTLQYQAVLPDVGDVSWSSDMRYAAVGAAFGHGGLCG